MKIVRIALPISALSLAVLLTLPSPASPPASTPAPTPPAPTVSAEAAAPAAAPSDTAPVRLPPSVPVSTIPASTNALGSAVILSGTDTTESLGLLTAVLSAADDEGLTVDESAVTELKGLDARTRTKLNKYQSPADTSRVQAGVKKLSDAIIAEAKANPAKPINSGFIKTVLLKLCPLFPFC